MDRQLIYRGNSPKHHGYELSVYISKEDKELLEVEETIDNQKNIVILHINDVVEILRRYKRN